MQVGWERDSAGRLQRRPNQVAAQSNTMKGEDQNQDSHNASNPPPFQINR